MTALVETRGLSRRFGGLQAVDGVDFTLPEGEIRAIIGPNGAGKTTFVGMICGRVAPSSGSILFDGADITSMPADRRVMVGIAYTFQITSIFANLTVEENVTLAAMRRHVGRAGQRYSAAELQDASLSALERVDLQNYASKTAGNLAYGHQRLLEVAMGLALEPRLLVLDEPTQGLSDTEIEGFIELVRDIGREATVLLIEHNMPVVMALAETITVMDRGRIIAEGTPEAIRADRAVQEAYLGAPADG
ncbi:MAG: ABC transporter ATP-binding protein [Rhizobiaceae bacterium]|nr:ABC transporter ATP-binding protein [Rhizobiaceae bacterium]